MQTQRFASALVAVTLVATGACESSAPEQTARRASSSTASSTTHPQPASTTTKPIPVGAALPVFAGTVTTITAADVPSSYRAGCPVAPDQLRRLHMSYWGFDGQRHVGSMVVNASVVQSVLTVFGRLYAERFPIRRMVPVDAYGGSDPASMDADNTSGFNCRNAVAPGPPHWSAHAYGMAIDVNTVENPYVQGGIATPAAGAAFVDRSVHRAGMAFAGGDLVRAFAAVGWQWGGRWSDPDYQHFSATGG